MVKWRRQYAGRGLAGLEDAPRPGGPRRVLTGEAICEILAATVTPPPESLQALGVTHWSSRRLADWLHRARGISVSHDSVTVLWRKFSLPAAAPHRGLHVLHRPAAGRQGPRRRGPVPGTAAERGGGPRRRETRIQALDRTQPVPPVRPGTPERRTHDHIRHGTTTLSAALEAAAGQVTDACCLRHRHQEFLKFLKKTAAACPGRELHVVCDNDATRKHAGVRAWLARPENQRITLHFVPAGCSWLNLVECFFSVITRQAIRRGTFTSVSDLISAISAFTGHWNEHPRPFTWTKDADEILASIQRAKTKTNSFTRH